MASLKGSRTEANLREAFAREATANHRYLWFAEQADVDGRPEVAEIFRQLASGETGHAFGHLELLAEIGDPLTGGRIDGTEGQVEAALESERHDATEVYPNYARVAADEGFAEIATWLENVARAERGHADRLERYLAEQGDTTGSGR